MNFFDLFYTDMIMKKSESEPFEETRGFKLNFFIIVTKCSFIILTICLASVMIMSFLTSVVFVELEPLSLKYALTFLRNSLLSTTSLTFNLAKHCFLSLFPCLPVKIEVRNPRVTKSSYETELRHTSSY